MSFLSLIPFHGCSLHFKPSKELLTISPPGRVPYSRFSGFTGFHTIFQICQVFPHQDIYTYSPWNGDSFIVFKVCSNIISQQVFPQPSCVNHPSLSNTTYPYPALIFIVVYIHHLYLKLLFFIFHLPHLLLCHPHNVGYFAHFTYYYHAWPGTLTGNIVSPY